MAIIQRIGFLASGAGSTFEAVVAACRAGDLSLDPVVIIGNESEAGVFDRAQRLGVTALHISAKTAGDTLAADATIAAALDNANVDLVVLAGYLKMIGPAVLAAFEGRIINTHPALLPKFGGPGMYGMNVHRAVLAASETTTGVTVHVVDDEYDHGPVLAQVSLLVEPGDTIETLAARVQQREKLFLVETLGRLARGELELPQIT